MHLCNATVRRIIEKQSSLYVFVIFIIFNIIFLLMEK